MKISLIIAYYQDTAALALVFEALQLQSYGDFEVIIAEDDHDKASAQFIQEAMLNVKFPLMHVHQIYKEGFRKTEILNKAIKKSTGTFLVFIDGDCIPHKNFLETYADFAKTYVALFGQRLMLSQSISQQLYAKKRDPAFSKWSLWRSKSKSVKSVFEVSDTLSYVLSGKNSLNWGIHKQDIEDINGFDEDYQTPGAGTDLDLRWRLKANGISFHAIQFSAIIYQLFQEQNYKAAAIKISFEQLEMKKAAGHFKCINGLSKYIA